MSNMKEPLKVFSWLRKFVKACDDNDVSEGMGLFLIPNFVAGDAETRFTWNLPVSDIAGGRGSLGSFPAAVNWLLSTYAEPHALGLAQDKFSRAALVDNEGVDAFAARLRSLAELCGNIHSEGMIKQLLIRGQSEYLRTDAFVDNSAQRSYQQLSTYVAGKYRAAKDVMALASRGSPGDHRGRNRRRRSPEVSWSTNSTPRGSRMTRRRTTRSRCCRRVPRGSARLEERPMFGGRPRRVPRCATCVGHVDTEFLIARF